MSGEWTLHCGGAGSETEIHVDWRDEDNVPQRTDVTIAVAKLDNFRTLFVIVNGVIVAEIPKGERYWIARG